MTVRSMAEPRIVGRDEVTPLGVVLFRGGAGELCSQFQPLVLPHGVVVRPLPPAKQITLRRR
jgi:hypothetical protein